MKRILLLLLLVLIPCQLRGQALNNGIAPSQNSQQPLFLQVTDGDLTSVLGTFQFKSQNIALAPNATNYVYLDLVPTVPTLKVNTTGFPAANVYTVAIAVTNSTTIVSLTDSRPPFNSVAFSGGGGGGGGSGSGTLNTVTCWGNATTTADCPDITDAPGAPTVNAPLKIASGSGATSVSMQEGPPANCLLPAAGQQILCSINSPDSLVLSSNGNSYAPIGSGGGGGTPAGATGDLQFNNAGAFANANTVFPTATAAIDAFGTSRFNMPGNEYFVAGAAAQLQSQTNLSLVSVAGEITLSSLNLNILGGGGNQFNIGSIAASGTLGLVGSTSGTATITAPAVADTTNNPIVFSNAISVPACFGCGGGGGGLGDPGANGIVKRTSLNVTAPAILSDFTALGLSSLPDITDVSGIISMDGAVQLTNQTEFWQNFTADGSITNGHLVKFSGTVDHIVETTTSDTGQVVIGVARPSGTVSAGTVVPVARWGSTASVAFDNLGSCTSQEPIVNSTTVNGNLHCTSTPGSAQVIGGFINDVGNGDVDVYPLVNVPGGTATPPGGTAGQLQYNNSGSFGANTWTTNGSTSISAPANGTLNLSGASSTLGLFLPAAANAHPTNAGILSYSTTSNCPVFGNGTTTVSLCGGGSLAFGSVTAGTNTSALVIGTGGSLGVSGSGTIGATSIGGVTVTGTPSVGYVPTATSGSAATWQAQSGGGGSGTWAGLTLSGTNTGTGMVLAPSSVVAVPFTVNAPSGQSVDIFDIMLNGVKQTWWDSSGNMNFLGTNFNVGSSTSTTAGVIAAHGGNTSSLPGCFQAYNNADTINTNLCSSATNGHMMMLQGPATGETVQYFLESAPTINAQTGASYAIISNIVAGTIDYGRIITRTNAGAMSDTIGQAGAGTSALTELGFGNGWHTQVQVLPGSVGSDTITATTSTFIGCDSSPASTVVISPGNSIEIVSDGANYRCTRFAGTVTAGTGTVTSVATTAPITGGTFTTSGTIACATCVTSSSPGAGIAHFAGSTQAVTSSAIVAADITNNTITGTQLASSLALTTPNIGAATGTSLLASGIVDGTAPMLVTTSNSATLGGTYNSGYTINENATLGTAITYTLPTAAAGKQYCVANGYSGGADTGTLELLTSASGQFIIYTDGTLSATGGYVQSSGAAGDAACVVGVDATHWMLYTQRGTWAKH